MQALVIGDIHGCLDKLLDLTSHKPLNTKLFLVGDLIDRGPDSRAVINYVRDNNIACVKGNHELMACEVIPLIERLVAGEELTPSFYYILGSSDWFFNGGKDVFTSYDGDYEALLTDLYFLNDLPLYIETGIYDDEGLELLVSHTYTAWRDLSTAKSTEVDFCWDREQPTGISPNYYNVFGHTPTDYVLQSKATNPAEPVFYPTAANIDTGAPYKTSSRGILTGLYFPSLEVIHAS